MKKSEFIAAVAKEAGITRVQADKVVNAALSVIGKTLKGGDKVTLTGFGTFEVRERAARAGMNIRTGEKIRIPASKRPVFSPGAVLRSTISDKKPAKSASKTAVKTAAPAKSGKGKK